MAWNWENRAGRIHPRSQALGASRAAGLLGSGELIGAFKHIGADDRDTLKIELIGDEALKTSEIEGELLDRASVQSSLREQFGHAPDHRRVPPAERGIAEMMVDLYRNSPRRCATTRCSPGIA